MSDDDDEANDTGPLCRHWMHYGDCWAVCANCGCSCETHGIGEDTSCDDCSCAAWQEEIGPK